MKKILIAVVALGALYTASAYCIGFKVESEITAQVEQLTTNSPNLVCTLKQKHRGIFESSYTYGLDFNAPPQAGKDAASSRISFDATWRVAHGPIPFAAKVFNPCLALASATFSINPETDADIREVFDKLPELLETTIHARYGFDLGTTTDITMPPVDKTLAFADTPPFQLAWQGLTANVKSNSDLSAYTMTVNAPGLSIKDSEALVSLSGLSGSSEFNRIQGLVWGGDFRYLLKSLTVEPASPGKPFEVRDLALALNMKPIGPVLDYALDLSGTGKLAGGAILPARLGLTLHSVDLAALNDLLAVLRNKSRTPESPLLSPEDYQRTAKSLLARSPWFEVTLSAMEGGEGPVAAQANVKTELMKDLPDNLLLAFTELRAGARIDAPEKTFQDLACLFLSETGSAMPEAECRAEVTEQLDAYVSRGYLIRNGGKLSAQAQWNGQGILINGKPM
jgi:uncharacterized protein YdgA (DUF945 family)